MDSSASKLSFGLWNPVKRRNVLSVLREDVVDGDVEGKTNKFSNTDDETRQRELELVASLMTKQTLRQQMST